MSTNQDSLSQLQTVLITKLLEKLNSPDCTAQDMRVALDTLKHNGIQVTEQADPRILKLATSLPFPDAMTG